MFPFRFPQRCRNKVRERGRGRQRRVVRCEGCEREKGEGREGKEEGWMKRMIWGRRREGLKVEERKWSRGDVGEEGGGEWGRKFDRQ